MNANITLIAPVAISAPAHSSASERTHALSTESFEQARAAWKTAAREKRLSAASLAAWAIIRGADPKKGFAPITNSVKLANGACAWGAFEEATRACSHLSVSALAPWEAMLTQQGAVLKGWRWEGTHPLLTALLTSQPS